MASLTRATFRFALAARPSTLSRPLAARYTSSGSNTETGGSTGTHEHDGTPESIEAEKHRNLSGKTNSPIDHAPKWNSKLASSSEARVKADKDTRSPEELQKATVSHLENDTTDLATEATRLAAKAKNVAKDTKDAAKSKLGL